SLGQNNLNEYQRLFSTISDFFRQVFIDDVSGLSLGNLDQRPADQNRAGSTIIKARVCRRPR
ncbi:MAG: hypothetical protein AAF141_12890, partial [Pseudomonadota bacterium]